MIQQTSSTYQPGYGVNETPYGNQTHNQWVQVVTEFLASMWANGGESRQKALQIMSPAWYSAQYGEPDPSDIDGDWSARTLMAFSRFAAGYKPGQSPLLDQVLPYVAPGPNEFIEDPDAAALRIGAEQFNKSLDLQAQQLAESGRQFDADLLQRQRDSQQQAFLGAFQNELNLYAQQLGAWDASQDRNVDVFNTQSGVYTNQEANRSTNLREAGGLASILQQIYDQRTGKAIDLHANPGDTVAREYAVRALQAPQGTSTPAYTNVDALSEVIRKLIDYQPNAAPVAPEVQQAPMPTAPNQSTYTPPAVLSGQGSTGTAPAQGTSSYDPYATTTQGEQPLDAATAEALRVATEAARAQSGGMTFARGIQGTTAKTFISGDPRVPGQPNPELVEITGQNVRTKVTPLAKAAGKLSGKKVKKFAEGTNPAESDLMLTSYPDEVYQNDPSLKYLQGGSTAQQYNTLKTGTTPGAFGTALPESGSINYGKFLDVARDPVSLARIASFYKSGNRDIAAEVARAKARAPFGQAVQTSLIRT